MSEPDRFAIIPIFSDSVGCAAIPQNAVAHGSWSAITGRIRDSKQQRQLLTIINDAEHAKGTLATIRAREKEVAARQDAVTTMEDDVRQTLLADFIGKLDALARRMDAIEQERARDPHDDELPLPPGTSAPDDGHLQAPIAPPDKDQKAVEDTSC